MEACLDAGMDEILTKPVNRRALLSAIERLTGGLVEAPAPWRGKTVLVADDVEINRALARKQLERLGLKCEFAEDGQQALDMTTENRYDAVFVDINMPRKDGMAFIAALRELEAEQDTHTPVIAMTGEIDSRARKRFIKAGMDDYLAKPVDFEQLSIVLGRCLSDPAATPRSSESSETVKAAPAEPPGEDSSSFIGAGFDADAGGFRPDRQCGDRHARNYIAVPLSTIWKS